MHAIELKVTDFKVRITSNAKGLLESFREIYKNYVMTEGGLYDSTLDIQIQDMSKYLDKEISPFKDRTDSLIQTNYMYSYAYNKETCDGTLLTNLESAYRILEDILVVHTSYLVLSRNRFLFHCATVCDKEKRAYVFFGPSGIGKSTLARNSQGKFDLISDDLVVFDQIEGNLFHLHKTPFTRDKSSQHISGPFSVEGFYRLHQASDGERIDEISDQEKLLVFLGNFWSTNNQYTMKRYIELGSRILKSVPFYNIYLSENSNIEKLVASEISI